jgi:hypothetical protein
MKSEFIFQSSPFLIIPCLLAGVLYAWFLYSKKSTISRNVNIALSVMRCLLVSGLAFLLLNFFVKNNTVTIDKPVAVLAIDNSSSLKNLKLNPKLEQIIVDLKASGREIAIEYIGQEENQEISKVAYNQKTTDLSALIAQVKSNYDGRNLTDVILISDGIVNAGVSPIFKKYNIKIHAIGVGDTLKKIDIRLGSVYSNKLAYIGNKFPVQVDVNAFGFSGKQSTVVLKEGGVVIDKQVVSFTNQNDLKTLTLYAIAKTQGLKRYTVEVLPIAGEASVQNNKREIIVEVINGKEKVLIVGLSPHPDIKAIKTMIEKNELYEVQTQLLSAEANTKMPEFDILIMHQLPDIEGMGQNYVLSLMAKNKPTFFIIGSQTNIPSLNGYNDVMGIQLNGNQGDNVSGKYNENFKMFNFDSEKAKVLEKLPPIRVPFAEFRPSKEAEILLYQKILNTTTNKPLLAVNINATRKVAIFAGEGIWKWRMEEFALTDKQEAIDELFLKTLQLLSVKDDKKKLRVNPTATQYVFGDKVVFETEAYNNIYEKVYDQNIKMSVTDSKGKKYNYEYVNTSGNNSFEVSDLPAGDYSFTASTKILGKDEAAAGQFFISDVDLESQDLTADWNLLRTIAQKNEGQFVSMKDVNRLIDGIQKNVIPAKLSNKEEVNEPINLKYLFFLFLIFISAEWVIRKYLGTY